MCIGVIKSKMSSSYYSCRHRGNSYSETRFIIISCLLSAPAQLRQWCERWSVVCCSCCACIREYTLVLFGTFGNFDAAVGIMVLQVNTHRWKSRISDMMPYVQDSI